MKNNTVFLLFILLLLNSCIEKSDMKVIKPLNYKSIKSLSDIIDTIEIIELENSNNSYISEVIKVIETQKGQYIVKDLSKIMVFDNNGKFLRNIGKYGKGPGEFNYVNDIALNKDETILLVLDPYNQVYRFSLDNGSFLGKHKYDEFKKKNYDAIATAEGENVFLFATNPLDNENNFDLDFYCLDLYSEKVKIKDSYLLRNDFLFNPNRITRSYNGSYFVRPLEGSSMLYRLINGKIKEEFSIDFEGDAIPQKHIYSFGKNPWEHIQDYINAPYYKIPIGFLETEELMYFYCSAKNAITNEFLFNKHTQKGVRWENTSKNQIRLFSSDSIYFKTIILYKINDIKSDENKDPFSIFVNNYLKNYNIKDESQLLLKLKMKM